MSDEYRRLVESDEKNQIAIDFDGVIHANSRGYHDGSVYDDPVPGALLAIEELSKKYTIVVFTCKARSDRILVDGKTGTELVWAWLEKHNISQFIESVTAEKPRAAFYIDDKAYRFNGWRDTMKKVADQ